MAAGQGFKTFTTGEVLTAADVNGYLMQGINVFASSAARSAAITSPQEGQYSFLKDTNALEYYDGAAWVGAPVGDITAVTAGKGLTGGGSSGDVTVSLATTAKGDLVAGSGASTAAVLTVGSNGETIVADSSTATGLKWAAPTSGGETLISTTTLSGASTVLSSVPTTYNSLKINIYNATNSTADGKLRILGVSQNVFITGLESGTAVTLVNDVIQTNSNYDRTNASNGCSLTIENYTIADPRAQAMVWSGCFLATGSVNKSFIYGGTAGSTNGWATITISNTGGNWAGGTVKLYGVK